MARNISFLSRSTFAKAYELISAQDRCRLGWLLTFQVLLGVLDIVGVALFGLVGALAVSGVRFNQPEGSVETILNILNLGNFSFQSQVALLGIIAAMLLIAKTIISVILTRRTMTFLGNCGAEVSTNLLGKLLNSNLTEIKRDSIQTITYKLTGGVEAITIGIIGSTVGLIVDGSLLVMMVFLLATVQPVTALATFGFFVLVSASTYLFLNKRSVVLGKNATAISIDTNLEVSETLNSYREITVRDSRSMFLRKFQDFRFEASKTSAEMQFLPNVSKYIMETSVVVGALLVAGVQFLLTDANKSISSLAIFMIASSRIAPAVLRVQQNAISLKSSVGQSTLTFDLINQLRQFETIKERKSLSPINIGTFSSSVDVENLSFTYPENSVSTLKNISLRINPGSFVAIVGPSGSGKSTLVDCLLGLHKLDSGKVLISNLPPLEAFQVWPNEVSYVPQEVQLFSGSIRKNVAVGLPRDKIDDKSVFAALELANLSELLTGGKSDLDNEIGAGKALLSGGQRQRLGIARALYSKPSLLILDEATSALDGNTEANISMQLNRIKREITIIMIAHRLSTIRSADLVVYLDKGKILASGSFDEVRKLIPSFDEAAQAMGL